MDFKWYESTNKREEQSSVRLQTNGKAFENEGRNALNMFVVIVDVQCILVGEKT